MSVGPLEPLGNNAAIGTILREIRRFLEERVGRLEIAPI